MSILRHLGSDQKWMLTFPQHLGRYSLSTEYGTDIFIGVVDTHQTRN